MADNFPLKKLDKQEVIDQFDVLAEAIAQFVNKEMSSIQSDVQRILNVVQESGMEERR